jgi:hypothetical protein
MKPLEGAARAATTILGFAAVTVATTLALCAPRTTHADGDQAQVAVVTKGEIQTYGFIEARDTSKTGYVISVHLDNPGDAAVTGDVDVTIMMSESSPNARVAPAGTAVWRKREKVTLAAHESKVEEIECPASIAKQMKAVAKVMEKRQELVDKWQKKGDVPTWVWSVYNSPVANYRAEATKVGA